MNTATARISCWRCGVVLWTEQDGGAPAAAAFHVCAPVPLVELSLVEQVDRVAHVVHGAWPAISWWGRLRFSVELPVLRQIARFYDRLRMRRAR